MNIVADENIPFLHEFFSQFGEVKAVSGRNLSPPQLADADILLVRSVTIVNESLLKGSKVRFVGTCTIGVDHLDEAYLKRAGIAYASAPGCNAGGVLQYVLSAIASLDESCFGKQIGVVGSGNVGSRICSALRAMGVKVVAYDPFLSRSENPVLTDLGEVLASDVICMHTPYTRSGPYPTHHMINADNLPLLKPGAILLNAGRGGAIDNQALKQHLRSGADLRVILDVWENEPGIDHELMDLVAFATPHIAGYSFEGRLNGSAMIHTALAKFLGIHAQESEAEVQRILAHARGLPSSIHCHDITDAILASYRIRYDDLRTRAALKSTSSISHEFDLLRKTYPERREFSHFKVDTRNYELQRTLTKIGFLE